jgi:hypothetical protein
MPVEIRRFNYAESRGVFEAGGEAPGLEIQEMLNPLKIGTVLVQTDPFIPDSVSVQRQAFGSGWQTITNLDGDDLDRQIRDDGWNLMLIAGALRGTSWGSWSDVAIRCAALRLLQKAQTTKLNAFEITGIHKRRFVGIPYVVVTGHSRHLQESRVLQSIAQRIHQAARTGPGSIADGISAAPLTASVVAK